VLEDKLKTEKEAGNKQGNQNRSKIWQHTYEQHNQTRTWAPEIV